MTSFLLRESIFYAKENGSKLYVCFLDVKKTFDCVWHDGLFYKLYNSGINKTFCRLIVDMYTDMFSCVRSRNYKSSWFPVLQGTRQGGVISPFLYLVYINDLIYEIELSALGFCIYGISCGSPTVADDMLVGAYSVNCLIQMLVLCLRSTKAREYETKDKLVYSSRHFFCKRIKFDQTHPAGDVLCWL